MSQSRDIILVSAYYPPHLGGQENAVQGLAENLVKAGHTVSVVTSAQGSKPGKTVERHVHVERLGGIVFGHAPIMPAFLPALWRRLRPDSIVHVHIGQAFTPEMVWLTSKLRGRPFIAQLHIDFEPSGPAGFLLPFYKKHVLAPVLRAAAAVITLNQKTLHTVRSAYGYGGPTAILPNGIDDVYFEVRRPARAKNPPKTLRLLFVGRLTKQKNIPQLLEALAKTKRSARLDIIGSGEEEQAISQKISQLGLKNVTLHGALPRQAVLEFYRTCDALVMPSLYEAQPLVLLEAMASRVPIIGTTAFGIAEHLQNAGIIVEPSAGGLAAGIERLDRDYAALPELTEQAYQKAAAMRWQPTIQKYENLYNAVV